MTDDPFLNGKFPTNHPNPSLPHGCIFWQEIPIILVLLVNNQREFPFFFSENPLKIDKTSPKNGIFPQKFLILPRIPEKKILILLTRVFQNKHPCSPSKLPPWVLALKLTLPLLELLWQPLPLLPLLAVNAPEDEHLF